MGDRYCEKEEMHYEMAVQHYEMGKVLGKGRFGEVRLVTHRESGGVYACKIAGDAKNRRVLRQEAEIQREITTAVRESGESTLVFPLFREWIDAGDCSFLIMEYVEGTPLAARLQGGEGTKGSGEKKAARREVQNREVQNGKVQHREGRLTREEMDDIAGQLAEGLMLLHERPEPILYRDLKPEHVILCGDGRVRLLDLGCACRLSEAWKSKAGSPGYAAPEQLCERGHRQGVYSDVYSFGKVLAAMQRETGADRDWERLIAQCTAEKTEERIPGMRFILQELRTIRRGMPRKHATWMQFQVQKCVCCPHQSSYRDGYQSG